MFRQKSVVFSLLAAVLVVVVACSSVTPTPTAVPPTATPVPPTPTPEPTPTPVPVESITIDPTKDPAGFLEALPASEASCVTSALGGRDRVLAMLESALESNPITPTEADAIDGCISDETVQSVFVGQLEREAGGLSDPTVICIGERIGGLSAAALFTDEPQVDATISLLKGIFCLNSEERAAISVSDAAYGFGDYGGIDALECVVNGVGPTGLGDLMGALSSSDVDFSGLSNLFPLLIECGALNDSVFEETGITADQVGCLLGELGESGLALLDPSAADPELGDLAAMFAALNACGIALEDLLERADSLLDPNASGDVNVDPTAQTELTVEIPDVTDVELPFTEEQIACLAEELGDEVIANLLAGGAPDFSLFAALTACDIDVLSLLAP